MAIYRSNIYNEFVDLLAAILLCNECGLNGIRTLTKFTTETKKKLYENKNTARNFEIYKRTVFRSICTAVKGTHLNGGHFQIQDVSFENGDIFIINICIIYRKHHIRRTNYFMAVDFDNFYPRNCLSTITPLLQRTRIFTRRVITISIHY